MANAMDVTALGGKAKENNACRTPFHHALDRHLRDIASLFATFFFVCIRDVRRYYGGSLQPVRYLV